MLILNLLAGRVELLFQPLQKLIQLASDSIGLVFPVHQEGQSGIDCDCQQVEGDFIWPAAVEIGKGCVHDDLAEAAENPHHRAPGHGQPEAGCGHQVQDGKKEPHSRGVARTRSPDPGAGATRRLSPVRAVRAPWVLPRGDAGPSI